MLRCVAGDNVPIALKSFSAAHPSGRTGRGNISCESRVIDMSPTSDLFSDSESLNHSVCVSISVEPRSGRYFAGELIQKLSTLNGRRAAIGKHPYDWSHFSGSGCLSACFTCNADCLSRYVREMVASSRIANTRLRRRSQAAAFRAPSSTVFLCSKYLLATVES